MKRRKFIKTVGAAGIALAMTRRMSYSMEPEMIEADLLIIGSGFAGLWAAISASDSGITNIAIVDKASVGRSGMSKMCAGATIYRFPKDDPEVWLRDVAEASNFLSRQDIVSDILDTSYARYKKLESWGVKYSKMLGQARLPSRGFKHLKMSHGPKYKDKKGGAAVCAALLDQVEKRNAKQFPKILVTDLLRKDGRVVGAVGINRITGEPISFMARAVILATADCSFRGNYACVDAVTGDGFRLAYDAGVRLSNMEFLAVNTGSPKYGFEGTGVAARYGGKFLNKNMKAFMKDYYPEADKVEIAYIVRAMAAEIEKGNAPPIFFDMSRKPFSLVANRALGDGIGGWVKLNLDRLKEEGENIFSKPQEWTAAIQTLRGGARTDRNYMTDLPGLFAAGMAQALDPGLFNGWSTMRAMGSGELAGKSAAKFVRESSYVAPIGGHVRITESRAIMPLSRKTGVSPEAVCSKIQQIIVPYKICVKKSADSLKTALAEIERIRDNDLPAMSAKDPHELGRSHEAANLTLSAELFLRASLERTETRSDHCRAEYPDTDNRKWLKWINIRKDGNGRPEIAFENVPLKSYPIQPQKNEDIAR